MSHLYIVRGLPGSGKTTFVKQISYLTNTACVEADIYMEMLCGKGRFDPSFLPKAHAMCYDFCTSTLEQGYNCFVSNTFTTEKELAPYIDYCKLNNHQYTVMTIENRHGNTSVHDVPESTMIKMKNRFSIKL